MKFAELLWETVQGLKGLLRELKFKDKTEGFEYSMDDWRQAVAECRCEETCVGQCKRTPGPMQGDDIHYLLDQVGWSEKTSKDCAEEVRRQVNTLDLERLGPWDDKLYRELLLTAV